MGSKNIGQKLLARARDSQHGWTASEVKRLYKAFGFFIEPASKHDLAKHPALSDEIKGTITRSSGEISAGYVTTAIKLIEMVLKNEVGQNE